MDHSANFVINIALRSAAVAFLILIAATLWRDHSRSLAARLGTAFTLGVASFAVSSTAGFAGELIWWHPPLIALATGNAIVFWLFARSLFDEDFHLRPWHVVVWTALAVIGVLNCAYFIPNDPWLANFLGAIATISTAVFAALALLTAFATWRTDLVEHRRHLRLALIVAIGVYTVIMTTAELSSHGHATEVLASTANALGIATLAAVFAWQLLRVSGNDLFVPPPVNADAAGVLAVGGSTEDSVVPKVNAQSESEPTPDPNLIAALERLMQIDHVYREESLTIGALSQKLSLPEHKLRRLINQGLGYRNFTTFLNRYRLAEVQTALADPKKAELPILTIALSAGFQSIGPFNRAFKASVGTTPSEYRRASLGISIAESENG